MDTPSTAWEETPGPQQSWSLGIQELLRPGAWFAFSPHVAHCDEDPVKLPPDSGALPSPSCKLCIPSHLGVSRLCQPMHQQ